MQNRPDVIIEDFKLAAPNGAIRLVNRNLITMATLINKL